MDNTNSKRAPNFTKTEEEVLVQLVKKFEDILECKRTDAHSNKLKEETWKIISKEFCSSTGVYRDATILRRKYENIKKKTKKKFADLKCHTKGTGDGGPSNTAIDSIDETIQSILGNRLTGMTSQFNSDARSEEQIMDTYILDKEIVENVIIEEANDNTIIIKPTLINDDENKENNNKVSCEVKDWGSYCPNMLRTAKSKKLCTSSEISENTESSGTSHTSSAKRFKKSSQDTWSDVGKAKLNLIEIQKQSFAEKHKLKMEKLKMEYEIVKCELEYKKKLYTDKN